MKIPFNKPYKTVKELEYVAAAQLSGRLSGDGPFTKRCQTWLAEQTACNSSLLTHSCTAALEISAFLLDIQPGDEVIMPSYTFVSTANAFVLRGGKPVFIDIREDTLNLDERLIESAITSRTRAIAPVHYAGVACEMDTITDIAQQHGLKVVEDSAQAIMSKYKGRALGSIGDLGAYSFHETKNLSSGEGGALLVNNSDMVARAEVIREKGTNRTQFFRGEVDKYTWREAGSSFLPGELIAAFLWAQLEEANHIINERLKIWRKYHQLCAPLEEKGFLRRPSVPSHCEHNAHMYYVLLAPGISRQRVLAHFKNAGIGALFHYVPLHSSPAGQLYGRAVGDLQVTERQSQSIMRLPLWVGLSDEQQSRIVDALERAID